MTALDRVHVLDVDEATVTVDAGVSLDTLLRQVVPHGLWVPVLPGTRQVTVEAEPSPPTSTAATTTRRAASATTSCRWSC